MTYEPINRRTLFLVQRRALRRCGVGLGMEFSYIAVRALRSVWVAESCKGNDKCNCQRRSLSTARHKNNGVMLRSR